MVSEARAINMFGGGMPTPARGFDLGSLKLECSNCNLRQLCMPIGLTPAELERIDQLVSVRRKLGRGDTLFSAGEAFRSLFAIRSGFFKTFVTIEDGREQVTGFQMAGEVIGLDGIVDERHTCDAVALEDSEVCVMPFDRIEELGREIAAMQSHVHHILSREIVREQSAMLHLGTLRAEERLAAFLLNLSRRLQMRGQSASELVLRMTRREIGSFLGLTLETVSRAFSAFVADGVIEVQRRHVRIIDSDRLHRLAGAQNCV